jgi:hypothetical protein
MSPNASAPSAGICRAGQELKPKKSGYGLLAKCGPGPSENEIDENLREMFRGFAQDVP